MAGDLLLDLLCVLILTALCGGTLYAIEVMRAKGGWHE